MFRSKFSKIKEKLSKANSPKNSQPKSMKNFEMKSSLLSYLTFKRLVKYTLLTNVIAMFYYLFKYNDTRYDWSFTRFVSRITGWLTQVPLPTWMRKPVFNWYCRTFGVNREEILDPNFENYKTVNEFFIRKIKVNLI